MTAPLLDREAGESVIEITLIDAASIDDAFLNEWRDLDANAAAPNPFFAPWFLAPALKYLSTGNVRLCVLRVDGVLAGLFPVETGRTYAKIPLKHFAVWKHEHCYNAAPLIRRGFEAACYCALLEWIDFHPEGARFLRLTEYPVTDESFSALEAACNKRGRKMFFQRRRERAVMTGGQSADEVFFTAFSGKKLKELRRQARRLDETGGAAFRRLTDPGDIEAAAETFLSLELKGWKGRREDATPMAGSDAERAFFLEAMAAGAREGAVICDRLDVNGEAAAMLFTLRSGDTLSAFKIAHDEALNAYSPGVLLLMEATKRALEDKSVRLFDSCARSGHPVADKLWRERMIVAQINIAGGSAADQGMLSFCSGIERAKTAVMTLGRRDD